MRPTTSGVDSRRYATRNDAVSDGAPAALAVLADHGFRMSRRIGAGASSRIYAASTTDGRQVAVKVPRAPGPEAIAALEHEARVLRHLSQGTATAPPIDIVEVEDLVSWSGMAALVLRPCADGDLRRWMAEGPSTAAMLEVLRVLARALARIHGAGVVHADLSPPNIVMHEGRPVIIDFAAASLHGAARPAIHGTLPYAAPEVLHGAAPTERADQFAFGCIAAELLTGRVDPDGPALAAATKRIRGGDALGRLIIASLDPEPDRRPARAADWAEVLARCEVVDDRETPARHELLPPTATSRTRPFGPRPPAPPPLPPARNRSRLAAVALGAAAVVCVAAGIGWFVHGSTRPPAADAPAADAASASPATASTAAPPGSTPGTDLAHAPSPPVSWDPVRAEATLTLPGGQRRYRMGNPGDQLLVGRWSCATDATPVLYRPSTGDLFEFEGWADPGAPAPSVWVQHLEQRDGTATIEHEGACDRVTVTSGHRRVEVRLRGA